jgi:2-iminobutanoate/2-iminopropanoate deaminase
MASPDSAPDSEYHAEATRCGDLLFLKAQTGHDPATGVLPDGVEAQTHALVAKIEAILGRFGSTKADILMVTLVFADIRLFKAVDVIYAAWLPPREEVPLPACTAYAAVLPGGALVQAEVIAALASIPTYSEEPKR